MKKKIILGIVLLLIIVISVIVFYNNKKTFDVDGQYIDELNNGIETIKNNLDNNKIKYEIKTSKNTKIYSALISAKDENGNNFYMSYNIDAVSKKVLNNEEVAEEFNYSLSDIHEKINDRINKYYEGQINEGYMDSNECDIECYKNFSLNIESIENMYSLYVDKNKLYIYLSFDYNDILEDKEYYDGLEYNPFVIEL